MSMEDIADVPVQQTGWLSLLVKQIQRVGFAHADEIAAWMDAESRNVKVRRLDGIQDAAAIRIHKR